MAFDKKAWMRIYMRAYRRGKRRKPRPGYFDKKAWSRPYMREYMRKVFFIAVGRNRSRHAADIGSGSQE
jgi:hypothetical protein